MDLPILIITEEKETVKQDQMQVSYDQLGFTDDKLNFASLIVHLLEYSLAACTISYYSYGKEVFISLGSYPLATYPLLNVEDYYYGLVLKLIRVCPATPVCRSAGCLNKGKKIATLIFETHEDCAQGNWDTKAASYSLIAKGKQFGFNFNNHCDEDIGLLKTYIKQHTELSRKLRAMPAEDRVRCIQKVTTAPGTTKCLLANCCVPYYLIHFLP